MEWTVMTVAMPTFLLYIILILWISYALVGIVELIHDWRTEYKQRMDKQAKEQKEPLPAQTVEEFNEFLHTLLEDHAFKKEPHKDL